MLAERAHLQAFVDKFRYNAKRAALVQSRIKAIAKLDVGIEAAAPPPVDAAPPSVKFPAPGALPSGMPIVRFDGAGFVYPGCEVATFKPGALDFGVDPGTRMALVGDNGAGKSTLLKLMSGALDPTSGSVTRASGVRVASFAQHAVDGLDMATTPLSAVRAAAPALDEPAARAALARFSVDATLASRRLYTMSGGQKVRVALALATLAAPALLLLDEPTNHLDMESIDALVSAIQSYTGAVVVVSHDAHLLAAACPDALYEVGEGKVVRFDGSFREYRETLRKRAAGA